MKIITRILPPVLLLLLLVPLSADAGLWPFGDSVSYNVDSGLELEYLSINRIAMSQTDTAIRLFPPFLQEGMIYVRGKAKAGPEGIDAVYFSTDGKKNWQNAAFLSNSTISFGFRGEPGKSYDLFVRVVDKDRNVNDVQQSHRVITLSNQNIHSVVETALNAMIAAYENKDPVRFIKYASGNFEGDTLILNAAVRRDFALLNNIDLQGIVTGISTSEGGRVHADVAFTRFVVSARTGEPLQDSGMTEIVFETKGDFPKVCIMKHPLIFGVSNASCIAVGTVHNPENTRTLVVSNNGEAAVKPFTDAMMEIINSGGDKEQRSENSTTASILPDKAVY